MEKPLSNVDLDNYIKEVESNGVNIFQSEDIKPTTHIEDLFDNSGHCVLFQKNIGTSIGHWLTMLRNPKGQYFFIDSYGSNPDKYNKNILKCLKYNKKNGVNEISVNTTKLQDEPDSATCGRYSIVLTALNKKGMPPEDMVNFLKKGGNEMGSVDKFIVSLFGE